MRATRELGFALSCCFSCEAVSMPCVPIVRLFWPVIRQGMCLSCASGVCCTPYRFMCIVFGSDFPYNDEQLSCLF
jgi:hypothetical protein